MLQASLESGSIIADSTGARTLVNSTGSGDATVDIDLVEVKESVSEDYEATEDPAVDDLTIMESAAPFSQEELADDDDYEPGVCTRLPTAHLPADPPAFEMSFRTPALLPHLPVRRPPPLPRALHPSMPLVLPPPFEQ